MGIAVSSNTASTVIETKIFIDKPDSNKLNALNLFSDVDIIQ